MQLATIISLAIVGASQIQSVLAGTPTLHARQSSTSRGVQWPSTIPISNQQTSQGCFTSRANMTARTPEDNTSTGSCGVVCKADGFPVMAVHGTDCLCGWVYPEASTLTDDDRCSFPCPGFPGEACGSIAPNHAYSVFNTGIMVSVENYEPPVSSSTRPATTSGTAAATSQPADQQTGTGVPSDEPNPDESDDGDNGPPVAAIAAGVVGGVVAIAAIAGGIWFYLRRKRNAEIEEEHRRNAAVNAFISGAKPPGSSSGISITDSRLEPGLSTRRLSDGSIADNQDYSRKILRVINA